MVYLGSKKKFTCVLSKFKGEGNSLNFDKRRIRLFVELTLL